MKKVILILLLLVLFIGCRKNDQEISNELIISNSALAAVTVNFRGNAYTVTVGETKTITDIPNGTYTYETAANLPAGAISITKGTHLDDTLVFTGKTKYTIFYSATLLAGVYELNATLSASNQEESDAHLLNLF